LRSEKSMSTSLRCRVCVSRLRPVRRLIAVCVLAAAALIRPHPGRPGVPVQGCSVSGTVIFVYDGDTVKVRLEEGGEEKVRFIGIDSPETDDERENVRFMAFMAKRFAFWKLYRARVSLETDGFSRDKYGRLLAYCRLADGSLFNELALREGYAACLRRFPFRPELMKRFDEAEKEARREGRGLWRKGEPPVVSQEDLPRFVGKVVTVRTICSSVEKRKKFSVLKSSEGAIEILIPSGSTSVFPDPAALKGRKIATTGFVERFQGRIQIVAVLPGQLELFSEKESSESRTKDSHDKRGLPGSGIGSERFPGNVQRGRLELTRSTPWSIYASGAERSKKEDEIHASIGGRSFHRGA
jgi:endonuclease YncB( thermonuclease family)